MMKAWILPIVMAVLAVGAIAYVVVLQPAASPAAATVQEYISGLKRWPGTWEVPTIKVASEPKALQPDVTINVDVMRVVFVPAEIRVKKGQVVRLRLNAKDSGLADMPELAGALGLKEFSGHGFQILGPYDVWITGLRKGVTREVTFKADVPGEFEFECTVFCSPAHYVMRGKLIVSD
jgi:heme/copper-type cytochrome/quinol oxidase subunit 2